MKIEDVRKRMEEYQNYIDLYERYEPKNMKEVAIKLYAEINNVNEVAKILNEQGYRKDGKLVAGKRAQVKLESNDVTEVINSKVEYGDQLHEIVQKILRRNRRRKGIVV